MTAPIIVIAMGFACISLAFYVIVFILLFRISGKLQEMSSIGKPGPRPDLRDKHPRGKQDKSISRVNDRLRSAEREQGNARNRLKRNSGNSKHDRPNSRDKSYNKDRSFNKDKPYNRDKSQNRDRSPNRRESGPPRPRPTDNHPVTQPAPKETNPEIKHGRRTQIKRRYLDENEKGAEGQPVNTESNHRGFEKVESQETTSAPVTPSTEENQ